VPQLLAEIDGVESLRDVIVIGATNREDLMIRHPSTRSSRREDKIELQRRRRRTDLRALLHTELPIDEALVRELGGATARRRCAP